MLFPRLALYLDNTGSASEKQIEQVLCFSLGLHYICTMNYWIVQNGKSTGPFAMDELRILGVTPKTLVWHKGLKDWTPAGVVPELNRTLFAGAQAVAGPQKNPYSRTTAVIVTIAIVAFIFSKGTFIKAFLNPFFYMLLPFAAVAIVHAIKTEKKWKQGQLDDCRSWSERTLTWLVVFCVAAIALFPFYAVATLLL